MLNEFAIKNSEFKNDKKTHRSKKSCLKDIANDSLFYFGLFLAAIAILHSLLILGGITDGLSIGINEIAVCSIGFINIFFIKIFKSYLL